MSFSQNRCALLGDMHWQDRACFVADCQQLAGLSHAGPPRLPALQARWR